MTPTPKVPVELGGKTRSLRLTFSALAALEDATGSLPEEVFNRATEGSPRAMAQIIWASLLHEDRSLTLDTVLAWLDDANIGELAQAMVKATGAAFGEEKSEGNALAA